MKTLAWMKDAANRGLLVVSLLAFGLAVGGVSCVDTNNADDPDPNAEDTYGIEGDLTSSGPVGKADNAGVGSLSVSVEGASTQVWEIRNQWEDTDTEEAREAGMAWEADSGLNWDEKYAKWVNDMVKIDGHNTYYETFEFTTPFGKTVPAPKLECAEIAIFCGSPLRRGTGSRFISPRWTATGPGSTLGISEPGPARGAIKIPRSISLGIETTET